MQEVWGWGLPEKQHLEAMGLRKRRTHPCSRLVSQFQPRHLGASRRQDGFLARFSSWSLNTDQLTNVPGRVVASRQRSPWSPAGQRGSAGPWVTTGSDVHYCVARGVLSSLSPSFSLPTQPVVGEIPPFLLLRTFMK